MAPPVLFEQSAAAHLYPRLLRHQRVGVLDDPVAVRVGEALLVAVPGDAVELQQPVLEPRRGGDLAGAHLVVSGFQAITALARAPPADMPTLRISRSPASSWPLATVVDEVHPAPRGSGGQLDQLADLDLLVRGHLRAPGRSELEGAGAARADVAEALDRADAVRLTALLREPGVDQVVAEPVGQRVGQHPRQPFERCRGKVWEGVGLGPQRHLQRRDLDSAGGKAGRVLKDSGPRPGLEQRRADRAAPEPDLDVFAHRTRSLIAPAPGARLLGLCLLAPTPRPSALATLQFQPLDGAGQGFWDQPIESVEPAERAQDPDQARRLDRLAALQPLYRRPRDPRLAGKLFLGQIALQPAAGKTTAELGQNNSVAIRRFNLHSAC